MLINGIARWYGIQNRIAVIPVTIGGFSSAYSCHSHSSLDDGYGHGRVDNVLPPALPPDPDPLLDPDPPVEP